MTFEERRSCVKELEIMQMGNKIDNLSGQAERIEGQVNTVIKLLQGNGDEGIVTKIALLKRLLKILWWWLSILSVAIMGASIKSLWN